jgi:hypothetical protein
MISSSYRFVVTSLEGVGILSPHQDEHAYAFLFMALYLLVGVPLHCALTGTCVDIFISHLERVERRARIRRGGTGGAGTLLTLLGGGGGGGGGAEEAAAWAQMARLHTSATLRLHTDRASAAAATPTPQAAAAAAAAGQQAPVVGWGEFLEWWLRQERAIDRKLLDDLKRDFVQRCASRDPSHD